MECAHDLQGLEHHEVQVALQDVELR